MKITIQNDGKDQSRGSRLKPLFDFFRSLGGVQISDLAEILVLVSVFLVPVFITFRGVGNIDFNKQMIVMVAGFVGLVIWFLKGLVANKLETNISLSHILSALFILFMVLSTVFSVWRWGSFWGYPQEVKENLLTYLSLFLFFIATTHIIGKSKVKKVTNTLTLSLLFVSVFGVLQLLGQFVLPFNFTRSRAFNTIGSVNQWAVLLASLIPVALSTIRSSKKFFKVIAYIVSLVMMVGVFLVGFKLAWIIVLIGTLIYMSFVLWKAQGDNYKLLFLPALFFSLSLGFGLLNINLPTVSVPTVEVRPSLRATFDISFSMLKESVKSWLLGWGPGTFKYGWSQFKDQSLNSTLFWNTRFTKGGSDVLGKLGTIGLPGTVSYVILLLSGIVLPVIYFWRGGDRNEPGVAYSDNSNWLLTAGLLSSFTTLSVSKFMMTHNTTLEFVWWLLLGLIVVATVNKRREHELTAESKISFIFSFLGIIAVTGTIFLFYLEGTRYLAEIRYGQAYAARSEEEVASRLRGAINLNPSQENFWRGLSDYYVGKANQEVNSDRKKEEKIKNINLFVGNAVSASKRSTLLNPRNVANWQKRGKTYQQMIGLSQGSFDWSLKSYSEAIKLEPTNPYLFVEKAITHMRQASVVEEGKDGYLDKAEESLRRALELKQNYPSAIYQMSTLYQRRGEVDKAIQTLEALKKSSAYLSGYNPQEDVGLAFQLGILYYNSGNKEKAMQELERAIEVNSNYANARYFLGLVYSELGYAGKAIEQFQVLKDNNPDNEEIQNIIDRINAGEPALGGGGVPDEAPIKEEPEEKQ